MLVLLIFIGISIIGILLLVVLVVCVSVIGLGGIFNLDIVEEVIEMGIDFCYVGGIDIDFIN